MRDGGEQRRSWVAMPAVWLIRLYQRVLSPVLPRQCRYYPSCSAYAVQALTTRGLVVGGWLTLRRLGRCHPWSAGGIDHVPPRPGDPGAESFDPQAPQYSVSEQT